MTGALPDPEADLPRMTLSEHLDELRRRLFISIIAIVVAMIVAFFWHKEIWDFAQGPYKVAQAAAGLEPRNLMGTGPGEGFFQALKLCFLVGLVVCGPLVIWQMWGFIAAGLYPHERKYVRIFFPISLLLFGLGLVASYKILIPFGLRFLIGFDSNLGVDPNYKADEYLSTMIRMTLAMGFVFLLPLVMLFLQAVDIVRRETFKKGWRWAVVLSVVLGMFLTDPSPVTQIMMAIPVVGLYFMGIWGGKFVGEGGEQFRWYKAWPIVLGLAAFVAMIVYSNELNDLFAQAFPSGGETPAQGAPEAPGSGPGSAPGSGG